MYQMSTVIEVPITTLAGIAPNAGTAMCIINPFSCFNTATFSANDNYLPFVTVSSGSTQNPFAANPTFTASPFHSQAPNTATFAIDSLQIDFVETESPLNVKGKLTSAFFY